MARDVQVDFGGELSELKQTLHGLEGDIRSWGDSVKSIGIAAFGAWAATEVFDGLKSMLGGVASFAKDSLGAFQEAAAVDAQLEAVIKSTGAAAGFSADELKELASGLQQVTLFGDEAIKSAETMIAQFRNIKGDQFKEVTALSLDMATRLGGDASQAAQQLGKALNDPIRGMQLLERQGITLSESQQELVKRLIESGDAAGAQSVLIGELQKLYGGAAAAAADASGGGFLQLKEIVGDIQEEIGGGLMPLLDKFAPLAKTIAQHFLDLAASFGDWGKDVASGADDWLPAFEDTLLGLIATIEATFNQLFGSIDKAKLSWLEFLEGVDTKALGEGPGEATGLRKLLGFDKNIDLTRSLFGDSITGMDDAARAEMERLRQATSGGPSFDEVRAQRLAALQGQRDENRRPSSERAPTPTPSASEASGFSFVGLMSDFAQNMKSSITDSLSNALNVGEDVAKILAKGFDGTPAGKAMATEVTDPGFQAGFEDMQSLFRRIQGSAASTEDRREEKKIAIAEQTRDAQLKGAGLLETLVRLFNAPPQAPVAVLGE